MRLPLLMTLVLVFICLLTDIYIYRCITRRCVRHRKFWQRFQIISSAILNVGIIAFIALPRRNGSDLQLLTISWALYTYLSIFISKLVFVVFDLLASLPRIFKRKRIMVIVYTGIAVAILIFLAMWWGALINRYRVDVKEITTEMPQLPEQFDGYRIVQISDLHVGTYGKNPRYLEKVVERINSLNPDLIVFTGDLVNRRTSELRPFVSTLSRLHAKDGVYSILGNHDYGDYSDWRSPKLKEENLDNLKKLQKDMGWHLLLDRTERITRDSASIALIGVENIGDPPFKEYGSLERAYPYTRNNDECKILLTHNPAHWVKSIADNPYEKIDLTLSGHTHAMQLTVGRWSPAKWVYPTWGGMYFDKSKEHKLYVNIGLGSVGMPMRIGATPEVTLFTLTKSPAKNCAQK